MPEENISLDAAWRAYLAAARDFWSHQDFPADNGKVVLVELLGASPAYTVASLHIANYLRLRGGAGLVAVVHDGAGFAAQAARACGAGEIVAVNDFRPDQSALAQRVAATVPSLDLPARRAWVLGLELDGLAVGDLVYDSFLRFHAKPTLDDNCDALVASVLDAGLHRQLAQALIRRLPIESYVTGHRVYAGYGTLARSLAQAGIPVFSRKPAARNFALRRYRDAAATTHHEYTVPPSVRGLFGAATAERLADQGLDWITRRFRGEEIRADQRGLYTAFQNGKATADRAAMLGGLGLDPGRFTIASLSHSFSDEPHAGAWQIHDDYYLWMVDTLEQAARQPHVNWLIKPHPDTPHYGLSPVEPPLVAALAAPNIRMFPEHLSLASLAEACDAIVTVRSSAALEFSVLGKPVAVCGECWFDGWDFATTCRSRESYLAVLADPAALPRPSARQTREAALFAGLRYRSMLVECAFVPPCTPAFWTPTDWPAFLAEARRLLTVLRVEDDPVFRNLNIQLDRDLDHLLDFEDLES